MGKSTTVIVVGAGPAGIAAATRLYENGIKNVTVLEAEDRIGGRIHTVDWIDGNVVDLGAQWIHGEEDNAVFQLVKDRKDLYKFAEGVFEITYFIQSSSKVINVDVCKKFSAILNEIRYNIDETELHRFKSSGDYFSFKLNEELNKINEEELSPELKDQFVEWFHQFINSIDASETWFDSSVTTLTEYKECEGNHLVSWINGYSTILDVLMEKSEKLSGETFSKNIITNVEVKKILLDGNKVQVVCDDKTYTADHVIVTVSLGVLKEKYSQLFEEGVLSEEKIKAIQGLAIGAVDKMFLKFPHQWWPNDIKDFNFLWNSKDREDYKNQGLGWLTDVFSFNVVEHVTCTLCGWVVGPSAREMEKFDEEDVKDQLMQLLRKFLGAKFEIPEPEYFGRSTWYSNEHFRGSYSYRSILTDQLGVKSTTLSTPILNKNSKPAILFAGEATHNHYYSTVHGAVETGWREADRITSLYKKKAQPRLSIMNSNLKILDCITPTDNTDPFQDIFCAIKDEKELESYFAYELAPVPPSLFDENGIRKTSKSALYNFFKPTPNGKINKRNTTFVVDGGFLLHKIVWPISVTFAVLYNTYISYVKRNYNENATIVFDGYSESSINIKNVERQRRTRIISSPADPVAVIFDETMQTSTPQQEFLANEKNKAQFIDQLSQKFLDAGIQVKQSVDDADVLIVSTAVELSRTCSNVVVVGEDVDLLVLVLALTPANRNLHLLKPGRGKVETKLFSSTSEQERLPNIEKYVLFTHAFSGCDTTSAIFRKGKLKSAQLLQQREELQTLISVFNDPNATFNEIDQAGELFFLALYDAPSNETSLNSYRFQCFKKLAAHSSLEVLLKVLPPTSSAAYQHSRRVYCQVQQWLGKAKKPSDWGWKIKNNAICPITSTKKAAPDKLLKLVT